MLNTLTKSFKNLGSKILIIVIALSFAVWGIGDIFTTNTSNLCPLVSSGNVNQLAIHFVAHFKSLAWCNPFGWMGGSVCAEAVEAGGTIGEGNVGATKLISKSNSKIIFVDTKLCP